MRPVAQVIDDGHASRERRARRSQGGIQPVVIHQDPGGAAAEGSRPAVRVVRPSREDDA